MVIMGVKGSWPGRTGVIILPRDDTGGSRSALSYSPGMVDVNIQGVTGGTDQTSGGCSLC